MSKKDFPKRFPFWARLKIGKNRPTLVIDDCQAKNKKTKKFEDGFVNREVIHTKNKSYEEIKPNPDKTDPKPMYLKRPKKTPKKLIKPFEKDWDIPIQLMIKYDKNNRDNKDK